MAARTTGVKRAHELEEDVHGHIQKKRGNIANDFYPHLSNEPVIQRVQQVDLRQNQFQIKQPIGLPSLNTQHTSHILTNGIGMVQLLPRPSCNPNGLGIGTAPKSWQVTEETSNSPLRHLTWIVMSTILSKNFPISQMTNFVSALQCRPFEHLKNMNSMLASTSQLYTEIANHYSSTTLLGAVHIVIATQLVNGAPLVVVENIFGDAAQSIKRVAEIREWYIKKLSQEAESSGFKLSASHFALYRGHQGTLGSTGAAWTGPKTWLPGMRNLYFDIPPEIEISVRTFANYLDDKSCSCATGNGNSHAPATTSTLIQQPQNIVSTGIGRLEPTIPHLNPSRKQARQFVNCHGCGCGEYNCDSCWCQCDDENCDGPHPDNKSETKEQEDLGEEDEDDKEESEESEESDDDGTLYEPSLMPRCIAAVNCRGCGCGNPRCVSCY
ncbi:hypothetical protein N431DRAFT_517107 [Stipitochalara longipes BDJ]|nr:hypothetical protein N431DRAFT_517107 [Stipitochalara longipes BDJ]